MDWNQILEDAIIGKVVMALIDEGYRVEMSNQDGGGWYVYAAEDGGQRPRDGYKHWVRLTPGNGADVITDYTTSLEAVLAPVNAFVERWQQ